MRRYFGFVADGRAGGGTSARGTSARGNSCIEERRQLRDSAERFRERLPARDHPSAFAPKDSFSSSFSSETSWHVEWQRRFACWWLALPAPTQTQISSCLGALSLHLGSRLDSALRGVGGGVVEGGVGGGGVVEGDLSRRRPERFEGATDRSCGWIFGEAERLQLPEFPALEGVQFSSPPIRGLLPARELLLSWGKPQRLEGSGLALGHVWQRVATWSAGLAAFALLLRASWPRSRHRHKQRHRHRQCQPVP